jgi:D-serine deaminase-like pyridoxal phosphate-dependent protein
MYTQPTLILDEQKCKANIHRMAEKARRHQLTFRPHFKTHVSQEVGEWFRQEGVNRITVSSFSMAAYFAGSGWTDITVAFPVNIHEIDLINQLAAKIQLNIVVESVFTVEFLNQHLAQPVGVFLKIDVDYHRTGIHWQNTNLADQVLNAIRGDKLNLKGFLTHAGHSYAARGEKEILQIHESSLEKMRSLKARYTDQYPDLVISVGDTPTCSVAEDFTGVDEIRPGNFVFYDLMQEQIGACNYDQIAVAMACPVVALHPEREEIVVYGGGVHFAKDRLEHDIYGTIYGLAVADKDEGWSVPIPDVFMNRLSQEHGILRAPKEFISQLQVGDFIKILPVHSCMTADLQPHYHTSSGKILARMGKGE